MHITGGLVKKQSFTMPLSSTMQNVLDLKEPLDNYHAKQNKKREQALGINK